MSSPPTVPSSRSPVAWAVGTFFGVGLLGPGGGTFAAIVVCALWWGSSRVLDHATLSVLTGFAALSATLLGTWAANIMISESGNPDPPQVVMDEVAGQLFALIAAPDPASWKYVLASLILFRTLDILKPPPVSTLERLHGGKGVMLDDVAAGLIALAILQALLWLHIGF